MEDWSFLDILFRGAATLVGRRRKNQSRFETGQDVVAAVIVAGIAIAFAGATLFWLLA